MSGYGRENVADPGGFHVGANDARNIPHRHKVLHLCCLTQTSCGWRANADRVMLLSDNQNLNKAAGGRGALIGRFGAGGYGAATTCTPATERRSGTPLSNTREPGLHRLGSKRR